MSSKPRRIEALDVLRGLTVAMMILVNNAGSSYDCLHHVEWNGLTVCDMVFPFFLFIMGVSCYLSLSKGGFTFTLPTLGHIFKRTALIILVCWGIFWFGRILKGDFLPFDHFRLTGVLVRIALVYCVLSLLAITLPHKVLPYLAGVILAAYGLILLYCDGYVNGPENIIARVDAAVLGKAHLYTRRPIDPEGLLSTIPCIAHGILGFMCGEVLRSGRPLKKKMRWMDLTGFLYIIIGLVLSLLLPLNKRVWSPSFVMVTCGAAQLMLSLFVYIIDYRGLKGWTTFFKSFGMNALFIYVLSEVLEMVLSRIGFVNFAHEWLRQVIGNVQFADLLYSLAYVLTLFLASFALFRKKIFIKL